jgi:hypothetical protein
LVLETQLTLSSLQVVRSRADTTAMVSTMKNFSDPGGIMFDIAYLSQ